MQQNKQYSIDEKLIIASVQHNFQQVKKLIEEGANPKYIHYTGASNSYKGNTSTALSRAQKGQIKNTTDYINVIEYLLEKGSDPTFKTTACGPWGQHIQTPMFQDSSRILRSLKDEQQKIRFLTILKKYKININKQKKSERAKDDFGFRRTTCLLFDMFDQCRIKDKMYELSLLAQTVDFSQLRKEHQNNLRISYAQKSSVQMPISEYQKWWPKQQKQPPNVEFIVKLIELGANPNSQRTQYEWQRSLQEIEIFIPQVDVTQKNNYQTALHRCIMNNQVELVKILIEKGADVNKKCRVTIMKALYPHEWPKKLKQRKQKENSQKLKIYEEQKIILTKRIQGTQNQLQKYKLLKILRTEVEYKIFSLLRYSYENQCPVEKCQKIQLNCLQLAQLFKVDQMITKMLKQKFKKQICLWEFQN